MITIEQRKELVEKIHSNAVAKGFWDTKYPPMHWLALVVTELSEAIEAYRSGEKRPIALYREELEKSGCDFDKMAFEELVKDSKEDELADAVIRLYDVIGGFESDLSIVVEEEFMTECKDAELFTERIGLAMLTVLREEPVVAIQVIEYIAKLEGIDLYWHIDQKMRYNTTRPRLHGKTC